MPTINVEVVETELIKPVAEHRPMSRPTRRTVGVRDAIAAVRVPVARATALSPVLVVDGTGATRRRPRHLPDSGRRRHQATSRRPIAIDPGAAAINVEVVETEPIKPALGRRPMSRPTRRTVGVRDAIAGLRDPVARATALSPVLAVDGTGATRRQPRHLPDSGRRRHQANSHRQITIDPGAPATSAKQAVAKATKTGR
jgi:hypothetical protein